MKTIVLGSTSRYRQELLKKLGIEFGVLAPACDEDEIKKSLRDVEPNKLKWAERLSEAKSLSITTDHVLITSDQTVVLHDQIIGKSKTFEKAVEQLKAMQGHTHQLVTAVTVRQGNQIETHVQTDQMHMRRLTDDEIKRYLALDEPFDSAGSYKIEMAGIGLFTKIECADFSGIQGLPMIWLTGKLKELGYEFFKKN